MIGANLSDPRVVTCPCGARVHTTVRGGRRYCDDCRVARRRARDAERQRTIRSTPAYKARYRAESLVRRYGITVEQFDAIFEAQGRACGICRSPTSRSSRNWHVDHDHETGRVRGILCEPCNLVLGHAGDSPERLRAMIDYLQRPPNMAEAIR